MLVTPGGIDRIKQYLKQNFLFGNEPTAELFAILAIYFVQGILGISRLAVSFFLKDDLGLSPAEVAALMGVAAIPWMVKPLFGFISDGLPIAGYHRRPYLVLSGLLGCGAWVGLGLWVSTPLQATVAIVLSSLSVAVSDVIADSIVVERARDESDHAAGSLQSLTWGVGAVGGVITAYLGGLLLEFISTQELFLLTATFPLIVTGVAWLIAEGRSLRGPGLGEVKSQVGLLKKAIAQKAIWMPTLFLFLWQATPSADSAFFFFSTNELGFPPEFLGRVRLVSSLAMLIGVWLFQRFLREVRFRRIFGWMILISAVLGMTSLILVTHTNRAWGISDEWFSLGDNLVLVVAGQLSFMPVLILAARLCPRGIEATFFALLMSIFNFGGLLSHELGALLTHALQVTETDFANLWKLVLITNLTTLLPLPLLGLVPDVNAQGLTPAGEDAEAVIEALEESVGTPEMEPVTVAVESQPGS